jgi:hypothetical protein
MSMSTQMLVGCLPLLLTMPFLIAFYRVLQVAIELRGASFLWIPDLSQRDPLFITPVLMGISMFVMQRMTPTAMDPGPAAHHDDHAGGAGRDVPCRPRRVEPLLALVQPLLGRAAGGDHADHRFPRRPGPAQGAPPAMSDPVFTGQDVPDAVASAARSLGLEAARLRYVVLDPGRPGGLGVSASPARIAVLLERRPAGEARPGAVPRPQVPEDAQPPAPRTGDVRADIRSLVRVLGEAASVDLSAEVEEGPDGLRVRVQGAGCAMLLEEEGEVFQALEHVLQRAYRARLASGA